mgnify:CR=1 FL=1
MAKWILVIGIFMFLTIKINAQKKYIDSLMTVTTYLLDLKSTVNDTITPVQLKVNKLDSMVRLATKFQAIIDNSGKKVIAIDNVFEKIRNDFRFVIQSVILYKTDIKEQEYKISERLLQEKLYINKNIPPLVDKIYYYGSKAIK